MLPSSNCGSGWRVDDRLLRTTALSLRLTYAFRCRRRTRRRRSARLEHQQASAAAPELHCRCETRRSKSVEVIGSDYEQHVFLQGTGEQGFRCGVAYGVRRQERAVPEIVAE